VWTIAIVCWSFFRPIAAEETKMSALNSRWQDRSRELKEAKEKAELANQPKHLPVHHEP
jgi:hypothetical protein